MEIMLQPVTVRELSGGNLVFAAPREWLVYANISISDPLYCDMMVATGTLVYSTRQQEWSRKTTVRLQNRTPYIGVSIFHARAMGINVGDTLELEIDYESTDLLVRPSLTLGDA